MKNFIIFTIVLLLSLSLYGQDQLVILKNLNSDTKHSYRVIRQVSDDYIALINSNELKSLQTNNISYTVLDNNPSQNSYFLISNNPKQIHNLNKYAKILKEYDRFVLLRVTKENFEDIHDLPLRKEELDLIPLDLKNVQQETKKEASSHRNQIIHNILGKVSLDTMRNTVKRLQSFESRHFTAADNKNNVIPYLVNKLERYCDTVFLQNVNGGAPNVIGLRYGKKDSSRTKHCLLGAHLDGVMRPGAKYKAAGADDNGSGVAAVIECARVFKDYPFENTIAFTLFNGEEVGLLGSEKMAQDMKRNGHTIIGGAITYDMIGHSTPTTRNLVQVEGFDNMQSNIDFVQKYMQNIVDTYTKMKTYQYLKGFASDHVSFNKAGYVSVLLIEREYEHPAYHKDFDTLDCPDGFNDMELFVNITKTGTAAIADLAVPMDISDISKDIQEVMNGITITAASRKTIHVQLPRIINKETMIKVFSANGKLVHSVRNPQQVNKTLMVTLPDNQQRFVSGTYFVHVIIDGHTVTEKAVLF